jgi:hypothetical protein
MDDQVTAISGSWIHFSKDGIFYSLPVKVRDDGTLCVDIEGAKRHLKKKVAEEA